MGWRGRKKREGETRRGTEWRVGKKEKTKTEDKRTNSGQLVQVWSHRGRDLNPGSECASCVLLAISFNFSEPLLPPSHTALCTNTRRALRELGWNLILLFVLFLFNEAFKIAVFSLLSCGCVFMVYASVCVKKCVQLYAPVHRPGWCGCLDYCSPPRVLRQLTILDTEGILKW